MPSDDCQMDRWLRTRNVFNVEQSVTAIVSLS